MNNESTNLLQLLLLLVADAWWEDKEELLEESKAIPCNTGDSEDGHHTTV